MDEPDISKSAARDEAWEARYHRIGIVVMVAIFLVAPWVVYPVFLMKALCFALFACAFNLLIGFGGLLSFGHAMFLGMAGYLSAHAAKIWGFPPELAILTARRSPRRSASWRGCSRSAARASTSR
jgi:ABC-type branched-subunit amino acid transport system permease subunit